MPDHSFAMDSADRGPAFVAVAWVLTLVAIVVYAIRIYSRTLLTRSLGSDDFTMAFGVVSYCDDVLL